MNSADFQPIFASVPNSKDVNFYVVLSLRSFNRGLPLLPDRKGEIQITVPTPEDP